MTALQIQPETFANKKAIILDFDDVLYPKKDFLLQVYYLYANFVEFTNYQPCANELLQTLKEEYVSRGETNVFSVAVQKFPEISAFKENFERLHHQAQLPLKLLAFPNIAQLIKRFQEEDKPVLLLTAGDPLMQLNKIKQIDWQELKPTLKVYFEDELRFRQLAPLNYILDEHDLEPNEVGYIGLAKSILEEAKDLGMETLS